MSIHRQRAVVYDEGQTEKVRFKPKGERGMQQERQQILILCLSDSDLASKTVAWSVYDGSRPPGDVQMQTGDETEPPYASVLTAMQDGWRVIQLPSLPSYARGHEHETGHLPYECVLERMVTIDARS